jgi:regulation of enolase protein 1 (concanavalin A-like superfamily)
MHSPFSMGRLALALVCLLAPAASLQAQSPPAPWSSVDIGKPALAGSATFAENVFRIEGAGFDSSRRAEQQHFVYQEVSGDVDIRARVDSLGLVGLESRAGVSIRSSLADDAAQGFVYLSASHTIGFQRRQGVRGKSSHVKGPVALPPSWVRLVRTGTRLTAFTSDDGAAWTVVATGTVKLAAKAYVGLAVTSQVASSRTTADFSNVSVTSAALPAGQVSQDLGKPAISGATSYIDGEYTIRAGGAGIWDSADEFHFVYQPMTGDVEVVARVASISKAHAWSKAGVMIRESLAAGSRHAMALVSAGSGYAFHRRALPDHWTDQSSGGSGKAPGWVRIRRQGDVIEAFRSADGVKWSRMGSATIAMADTVYVGLAVSSHNRKTATTAVFDNLRVVNAGAPPNQPPAVILNAPAPGRVFTAPATLTLAASAADQDGSIEAVEFYANATLIGRDLSAPYEAIAPALPKGSYTLKAVAIDDRGASSISENVSITVEEADPPKDPPGSSPPVPTWVVFTASADHDNLVEKYVLEIYREGAGPGVSSPVAIKDLRKPTPDSNRDIAVNCSALFAALAPGKYLATVVAVGRRDSARSETVPFSR